MRAVVVVVVLVGCRYGFDERTGNGGDAGGDGRGDGTTGSDGAGVLAYRTSATGTEPSHGYMVDCTLTIALPPGVVDGDLLVGVIYTDGGSSAAVATPGWTRLALSAPTYAGFYKRATNEPASYGFAITAGTGAADTCESGGVISAFAGASASAPIDVQSNTASSGTTSLVAPAVTASKGGLLVALFGSNGPATGIAAPAAMTIAGSAASPGDWGDALIAWAPIAAGPTGTRTATIAQARDAASGLVVIVP